MNSMILFTMKRPVLLLMIIIFFASAGIFSLKKTGLSLMPHMKKQGLTIVIKYPGQSPFRIEQIITMPVEEAISTIGGIKDIVSNTREGEARIHVTFNESADMKYRIIEVREKIDPVRAQFPRDVNEPEVHAYSDDDKPVVIISLKSETIDIDRLYEIADKKYKKLFQSIEGVGEVIVAGGRKRNITVKAKETQLISRMIPLHTISKVIDDHNRSVPSGALSGMQEYSVSVDGTLKNSTDIGSLPLGKSKNGTMVFISDVAKVRDYDGDKETCSRRNGRDTVSLYIRKNGNARIVSLCSEIKSVVNKLPTSPCTAEITYDQSGYINSAINDLLISCLLGIIMASTVLFIFYGSVYHSFPVIVTIPLSLLGVFIYLYLSDITINVISLSGLAIAAGLVVDNAIVVQEALSTHESEGETLTEKVKRVALTGRALSASTLTTICIFIPIYLFGSGASSLYRDMAGAIITALIISLLCSLFIVPSLYSKISRRVSYAKEKMVITKMQSLFKPVFMYKNFMLISEKVQKNKKAIYSALIIFLTASIALSFMMKRTYIPPVEKNELYGSLDFKPGTSLDESSRVTKLVEKSVKKTGSVLSVSTRVNAAKSDLIFTVNKKNTAIEVIKKIKKAAKLLLPESVTFLIQEQRKGETSKSLDIEIKGKDIKEIRKTAYLLASEIRKKLIVDEVIYHFREGRPELRIKIDRNKAADADLSIDIISHQLRNAFYGPVASKFISKSEVDIRTQLEFSEKPVISDVKNIMLINDQGRKRSIDSIAAFDETTGISVIWRKNKERMESLSVKTADSDLVKLSEKIKSIISNIDLSPETSIVFGESLKKIKESNAELLFAVALSVLLVFMVTASLFESLKLPLLVLLSIPAGGSGALFALIAFRVPISVPVLMGMVVLVGIVVNNAIILIDTYRIHTPESDADVVSLTHKRLKPILITTLTTVPGMIPLLFSGPMWFGFALTVISGLIVSALFVLLIVPSLYSDYFLLNRR